MVQREQQWQNDTWFCINNNKMTPKLLEEVRTAQQIQCTNYIFHKYSFGEEGTFLDYELIEEITKGLTALASKYDPNYIVSTEPGSHTWGLLVASSLGKSLNIIRTTNPKLTHKNIRRQRTGYTKRGLTFTHFRPGDSVLIIEDIIGTGSTIELLIDTLEEKQVTVQGVVSILRKSLDKLDDKYNIPVESLIRT